MAEKVMLQATIMVLKVDLQCSCCYKKIKKLLCKFPQIRDQAYDEKQNMVIIKVICCSPEKIRQKLICKGGKLIESIEIKEPEKPKPKEEKPKEEKPKPKEEKPKESKPQPALKPEPVTGYPPVYYPIIPVGVSCGPCYDGCARGRPCYHGYGRSQPCYDGCGGSRAYGRPQPCYDGCGCGCGGSRGGPQPCYVGCGCGCGGSRVYVNRCDYLCEENTTSCSVM